MRDQDEGGDTGGRAVTIPALSGSLEIDSIEWDGCTHTTIRYGSGLDDTIDINSAGRDALIDELLRQRELEQRDAAVRDVPPSSVYPPQGRAR
ncbi:hypothetical protein GCM10009764_23340 [Nocardia ninae]|uniref:Uncharacterized protein n=1 Tax=Nocardia ninae NBRC 108245 TaxID=1210091 RepID=A0A511M9Z9_9NOCA|nr:hypothetical protein NN4_20140 [Nocardia ninae NBRC 108245]